MTISGPYVEGPIRAFMRNAPCRFEVVQLHVALNAKPMRTLGPRRNMTAEHLRLEEARDRRVPWKEWGPYLSERAWGTVREDYSPFGTAWEYFPHDHARSRAYRWSEDGLGGICDRHQLLCFAIALWNGRDPILKERLFGLTGNEGKHGEDVKEYSFYLDSTPTHPYMKYLYKYPQVAYPYSALIEGNRLRSRMDPEYEPLDTGAFDQDRYFDVFVEYAKAAPDDILIQVTVVNRSAGEAGIDLLPTIWFRNTWSWGLDARKPLLASDATIGDMHAIRVTHFEMAERWLLCEGDPEFLFTENETNFKRVFAAPNQSPYVKDGINDYVLGGKKTAVSPEPFGTKASARYHRNIKAGEQVTLRLRLTTNRLTTKLGADALGDTFDEMVHKRRVEADEFYNAISPKALTPDERMVQRQAFAGLCGANSSTTTTSGGGCEGTQPDRSRAAIVGTAAIMDGHISTTPMLSRCRTSGNTLGMRLGILRFMRSRWR